eukprot:gene15075-6241_t
MPANGDTPMEADGTQKEKKFTSVDVILSLQKEIDSRKRKHAKIKLAAKTDHQTAQVDDFVSKTLQEPDRDNKMVKEKTVNVKDESDTKQADTKNSCLQQQEMMASGSSMDTSSHAKPGSLPIYPSSSVTVHVPYTGNHGQVSSPTIQHRQTAPGIKVGQTTAVIQKASPAPLPMRLILEHSITCSDVNTLNCHDALLTNYHAASLTSVCRSVPLQTYQSKYGELLNVIEDLGREIKPTYAGSKMAQERLKKGIMHARTLVRECLLEVDKSSRQ